MQACGRHGRDHHTNHVEPIAPMTSQPPSGPSTMTVRDAAPVALAVRDLSVHYGSKVALDHVHPARVPGEERQVRARARREVVEHAHARAVAHHSLDDVRTDEARAARDETGEFHAAIVSGALD